MEYRYADLTLTLPYPTIVDGLWRVSMVRVNEQEGAQLLTCARVGISQPLWPLVLASSALLQCSHRLLDFLMEVPFVNTRSAPQ